MLPAEILDCILSFLQKDRAALKSCSAAHPLLSSLAERHLFAHITIYLAISRFHSSPIDGYLIPQLSSCLSERPYLANQIRGITVYNGSYGSSESLEELSTILPLISRSEEFSLRDIRRFKVTRKFRSKLLDYLRTPHMQEIYLENSHNFPLAILDDARNIKIVKVRGSNCNFKHCASHPTPTSLESLFLADVQSVDKYITWAIPRVNNLISLHVKTTMHRFPDLSPILDACPESLRSLTLDIGPEFQFSYPGGGYSNVICPLDGVQLDLSGPKHLEVVTVYMVTFLDGKPSRNSLPARLIRTVGPSFKRLVLNIVFSFGGAHNCLRDMMEWKPLVLLCNSLSQIRVDLCIGAASHNKLSFGEVDSLIGNEDLSRLVEQGSVVIKPLVPHDLY